MAWHLAFNWILFTWTPSDRGEQCVKIIWLRWELKHVFLCQSLILLLWLCQRFIQAYLSRNCNHRQYHCFAILHIFIFNQEQRYITKASLKASKSYWKPCTIHQSIQDKSNIPEILNVQHFSNTTEVYLWNTQDN